MFKRFFQGRDQHGSGGPSAQPVAEWAPAFRDRATLGRFLAAVEDHFAKSGQPMTIDDGWVIPANAPPDGDMARYGLTNLAARCAITQESEWKSLVAQHFELVKQERRKALTDKHLDFDSTRDKLAVRLFQTEAVNPEGRFDPLSLFVAREDLPGLLTMLVVCGENSVRTVRRESIKSWPTSDAALFELGLKNSQGRISFDISEGRTKRGIRFYMLEADSMVGSSMVLLLTEIDEMLGTHGSVVSVPLRDLVIVAPLDEIGDRTLCKELSTIANDLYRQVEGSISPLLFWTDGLCFVRLSGPTTEDTLRNAGLPKHIIRILS